MYVSRGHHSGISSRIEFNTTAVVKYLQAAFIINAPLPTDSNEILVLILELILAPVSRTCSTMIPEDGRSKDVIDIVADEYFVLVASMSTSVVLICQTPMSTPWMVARTKVAEGSRMNRVIFVIERARRDAKFLISEVVGSFHGTTAFDKGKQR